VAKGHSSIFNSALNIAMAITINVVIYVTADPHKLDELVKEVFGL